MARGLAECTRSAKFLQVASLWELTLHPRENEGTRQFLSLHLITFEQQKVALKRNENVTSKDINANWFCASLLNTRMAIDIAMPGFNDLRRSVTPSFLLMDHFFLYRFSTFSSKTRKINPLEVWINCKMYHRIPVFYSSTTVSNSNLEKVKFCKNAGSIWY